MRYRLLGLLGLATMMSLCLCAAPASAQSVVATDSSVIVVDVLPLNAQVRLNGVLIGSGQELIAQSVFVLPGEHRLEFSAPGHLPTLVHVWGVPDWATRVSMVLVPDRR